MAKKYYAGEATVALRQNTRGIHRAVKGMQSYKDMGEGLSGLNTMRGGTKGFKGFVMEEMEAGRAGAIGRHTEVINNNGIADLRHIKADGTEVLKQMKSGYKPGQIDFSRYKGQTVVIDKGNVHFKELQAAGRRAGVKVVEGHVADAEAKTLADLMQMETKITGGKHAVITPKLYSGAKRLGAAHSVGVSAAKSGAIAGAGFSLGSNIVDVVRGNKTVGEAVGDVAVDTVAVGAVGYGAGAVGSMVASTAAGAAAIETAGAIGAAAASAPVIGTAITASTTAAAAIGGAATTAATVAMGAAGTAAGVVGGAGLVAAAAPVVIAAAPVVAVGAVLGAVGNWLFGD